MYLLANPCNGNAPCIELAGSFRCDCDQQHHEQTRSDTNQAVHRQKIARGVEFSIKKVEKLHYLCSENKGVDQLHGYRAADQQLCFCIFKKQVFQDVAHLFSLSDKKECTLLANPCNGNGICIELAGSYRCDCDQGWYGPHCQNGNVKFIKKVDVCFKMFKFKNRNIVL